MKKLFGVLLPLLLQVSAHAYTVSIEKHSLVTDTSKGTFTYQGETWGAITAVAYTVSVTQDGEVYKTDGEVLFSPAKKSMPSPTTLLAAIKADLVADGVSAQMKAYFADRAAQKKRKLRPGIAVLSPMTVQ